MKSYGLSITFGMNRGRISEFMTEIKSDYEAHYKKMGVDIATYYTPDKLRKKDANGKYLFELSMLQ
jgi:hypothetical protein